MAGHGPPTQRKNAQNEFDLDEDTLDELPKPPDGGWGWVVAFSSFLIHIITDGMTYSFGLFYAEFLVYFGEGKGYTAWIVSILVGVTLCSGPISSSFVNRYGCRLVTIAGAILASTCIFISMFAQNVLTLIFTIGIGTGMGLGLIYLPAIVSVTMYFEKYRSLATGIAVCGSGFGTFVFAPLTEGLIANYGWRGALLIISAIVLNCIIFGILFRPLEAPKRKRKLSQESLENELQPLKNKTGLGNNIDNKGSLLNTGDMVMPRSASVGYDMTNITKNHNNNTNGHVISGSLGRKQRRSSLMRATASQPHIGLSNSHLNRDIRLIYGSGTMYRPDIFYQGSLQNIPQYRSRGELSSKDPIRYGSFRRDRTTDFEKDSDKICGCITCSKETRDTFSEMMNFSLFRDIIFIIFVFSNFCTSIGFNVPYVYIAPQAEVLGLNKEEASYLLAAIGIANTFGRIILGYISDKPWVNRLFVYNVCLTICGLATGGSIFCTDFYSLVFYASVFGFTIGAYVGLTSVILVDLLGLEKLTNAFGLLLLFQGIASLIGPPFAGWLYDITDSYKPGFLLAGVTIAVSGLILFFIPIVQKYTTRKESEPRVSDPDR